MTDLGPIITPPGQYTHCVDRRDYRDVPGIADAGIPAILQFLLCDYLLGGKLVCLSGGADECAIGVVVGLEAVGAGKSGLDALDNDFSFNILLAPFVPDDFTGYPDPAPGNIVDPHLTRNDAVAHGPQGRLMIDSVTPSTLPAPVDQTGNPGLLKSPQPRGSAKWPVDGYGVLWKLTPAGARDIGGEGENLHKLIDHPPSGEWAEPPGPPDKYVALPVLHCECEGSRIFFVCQAMTPFLDVLQGKLPGGIPSPGEACRAFAEKLPFPLNKIVKTVCAVVEDAVAVFVGFFIAPYMAAAFAAAWEAAQLYDDAFITGPISKQIHIGDVVIVRGRWDWDAGHSGHTELHPVKSIQKLMTPPMQMPAEVRPAADPGTGTPVDYHVSRPAGLPPAVTDEILRTHRRWCALVSEAPPPPDPRTSGVLSAPQLADLTPEQLGVWAAQQRPENSWSLHPLVDGCDPAAGPVVR